MIVNYTQQGWEIISQRAHGLLSAAIAMQWRHTVRGKHWVETLLAIAEHDDAQVELEANKLLTETGGPADYSMRKMELEHCEATMRHALNKSTYIALLCSSHLDFLCRNGGATDDNVSGFVNRQKEERAKWLKVLDMQAAELKYDYSLLQWCDALSLLICRNAIPPESRSLDISKGPDRKIYRLSEKTPGMLTVRPWPFETDRFELSCEVRIIPKLKFDSDETFKSIYRETAPVLRSWIFSRDHNIAKQNDEQGIR